MHKSGAASAAGNRCLVSCQGKSATAGQRWLVLALMLLFPLSCASSRAPRRPYLVLENLDNAAAHMQRGEKEEAAQLYQAVLLADPFNEKAKAALAEIGAYEPSILTPSLLGKNRWRGVRAKSLGLRLAAYPLNRVLDILDVVSVQVGLEGGVYVGAHATRALQAAVGSGGGLELGWWQKRELGVGAGHIAALALGPFSTDGEGYTRVGTCGARSPGFGVVGLNRPSDSVYQHHRDYWGIGARAIALLVGAEVEVHPIELVDALCGIFFVDFLRDDIGSTRSLRLTAAEREAMADLMGTLSPAELRARMAGRAMPAATPAPDRTAPSPAATVAPASP